MAVLHGLLEREGYFTLDAPALGWPPGYMEGLARGVVGILTQNHHPDLFWVPHCAQGPEPPRGFWVAHVLGVSCRQCLGKP